MSAINLENPTLADVRLVTCNSDFFPELQRRRIGNALHSIYRWTGRPLNDIPATVEALRDVFESIEPAAHGITRPTVINARNLVMHAMAQSGLVPVLAEYRRRHGALSPAWALFKLHIESDVEWACVTSLVQYANDQNILPANVTDAVFQAYRDHREATSVRANQHTHYRSVSQYWNDLLHRCPHLNLSELALPASRLRRLPLAMTDFPNGFQEDVKAFFKWASGDDIFDQHGPDQPLSAATIASHIRRIHRVAYLLVEDGVAITELTSLGTLVKPQNYKRALTRLHAVDKSEQHTSTYQTAALLFRIARDWVKSEASELKAVEAMVRKLKRPKMEMTEKNKMLMTNFDDPAALLRLVKAPDAIWGRALEELAAGKRRALPKAQAALAINILITMPLRLQNLTNLEFDRHIVLKRHGTSSLFIAAEEVKGGRAIEFDIPEGLAQRLLEYRNSVAPEVVGQRPNVLFCGTKGNAKGFSTVRYLVQKYVKEYVGFHMNPHAFRHLCAKIILDANPGAHVEVQEMLGHASVETSTAFYAGLNSRRAGRHHHKLIAEVAARPQQTTSKRGKIKERV